MIYSKITLTLLLGLALFVLVRGKFYNGAVDLETLLSEEIPKKWTESFVKEAKKWDPAAVPQHPKTAVLIAGLHSRFIYKDMNIALGGFQGTDVFIVLTNRGVRTDRNSWSKPLPMPPPYMCDKNCDAIVDWFRKQGANRVDLTFVTNVSSFENRMKKPLPLERVRFMRNTKMLRVRELAYQRSLLVGDYDHYLFLREDNHFSEGTFRIADLEQFCTNPIEACYIANKYCSFGGDHDKIFYLNAKGAKAMFKEMTVEEVNKYWPRGSNSEKWIKSRMKREGVKQRTEIDFNRTDARYLPGHHSPCVLEKHWLCSNKRVGLQICE